MEENIERFERIRSYIKGEMSIEDRISFERDLLNDNELAKEFQEIEGVSKATVMAYKEKQLQEDLEMVEREMAGADKLAKSLHTSEPIFQRVKQWLTPAKTVISFAVAAALALGVFLPINNHNLAVSGYEEAGKILASGSIQMNTLRGDDEISDKLKSSYSMIQDGKCQEALASLKEVEEAIDQQISALSNDDSAIMRISELNKIKQDAEWYRAILLMHEKEVGKAKKHLKQIASSESTHSEEALRILKEVY